MQKADIESVKAQFSVIWCGKVQELTILRKSKMSQNTMAFLSDKSIKTIQRFEKYECFDPELMFIYKSIL